MGGCTGSENKNNSKSITNQPSDAKKIQIDIHPDVNLENKDKPTQIQSTKQENTKVSAPLSPQREINKGPLLPIQKSAKISQQYRQSMKSEVFANIQDLPNSLFKKSTNPKVKNLRLSKQVVKFAQFLPCEHTNSIFVRTDSANIDSMNILISGSSGTPYANGLYHFQLYCTDLYPSQPPKMQLLTGKGKVRFNPNLYQNGYICLSLLGTWSGAGCETWSALTSSIFQIFISIQSLVMTNDIHFNQPGFQRMKGSQEGQKMNEGYSRVVKLANIRYAMIEILKKPPKGFEKIVRQHFKIKKQQILQECKGWVKQSNKQYLCPGQNYQLEAKLINYENILTQEIKQLESLLNNLDN